MFGSSIHHSSLMSASTAISSYKEMIQVPTELLEFAQHPSFHSTLLSVRDQSSTNYLCLNRNTETGGLCILIDAGASERASLARRLIELHFKQQLKLMSSEARLNKVRTDLFSVQGEVASGLIVEFNVPENLIGIIIGKKGARLQRIIENTKVTNIQLKGQTGRVVIMGSSQAAVQAARELVELQEVRVEITPTQSEHMRRDMHRSTIVDIRETSGLVAVNFDEPNHLLLIGTRVAVETATKLLPTQMEYLNKQIEIATQEANAMKQLETYKKSFAPHSSRSDHPRQQHSTGFRASRDPHPFGQSQEPQGKALPTHSAPTKSLQTLEQPPESLQTIMRPQQKGPRPSKAPSASEKIPELTSSRLRNLDHEEVEQVKPDGPQKQPTTKKTRQPPVPKETVPAPSEVITAPAPSKQQSSGGGRQPKQHVASAPSQVKESAPVQPPQSVFTFTQEMAEALPKSIPPRRQHKAPVATAPETIPMPVHVPVQQEPKVMPSGPTMSRSELMEGAVVLGEAPMKKQNFRARNSNKKK